ncbi:MAG: hypothetical protein ACRCW2_10350 [Cellulosilyticaceae bacterium]
MKDYKQRAMIKWIGYILVVMILGPGLIVMMLYCMDDFEVRQIKEVNFPMIGIEMQKKDK